MVVVRNVIKINQRSDEVIFQAKFLLSVTNGCKGFPLVGAQVLNQNVPVNRLEIESASGFVLVLCEGICEKLLDTYETASNNGKGRTVIFAHCHHSMVMVS